MLSLPDVDTFGNSGPRSVGKIHIFDEQTRNHGGGASPEFDQSQNTYGGTESQNTTPSLTTSMSMASSTEEPPTPKEASPVPTTSHFPGGMLTSKYAFAAVRKSTPKSYSSVRLPPTPSTSTKPSKIPLPVKGNASNPKISVKTSLTTLQQLHDFAINRCKPPMTPPLTPVATARPRSTRHSLLSKGPLFPEIERGPKAKIIEPASIPLPVSDDAENAALSRQCGSEDLIVHDSEEDEALSPSPERDYEAPSIDFSHFAFVAKA